MTDPLRVLAFPSVKKDVASAGGATVELKEAVDAHCKLSAVTGT